MSKNFHHGASVKSLSHDVQNLSLNALHYKNFVTEIQEENKSLENILDYFASTSQLFFSQDETYKGTHFLFYLKKIICLFCF